jgi:2-polyprenyl-3-methyl-5-hydroxy-6-metoxy-1,4-benzoquinol methylase
MIPMSIPSNWFEDFFHGVTLDLWRRAISPQQTKAESEFLIKNLACKPDAHLLDVPCGNGRLSFELAQRGYHVTGVDISEEFIEEARSIKANLGKDQPPTAPTGRGSDSLQFTLGDMRSIEGKAIYDGAYCFGNSFGFMEHADMEKFLRGVAQALKPGARFIVETAMAAESVLPDFEEQTSHEIGDITMTIKERYVAAHSCVDSEYIFERHGASETRQAKHWIYTTAEIRRMLERAGFAVLDCYGSLKCDPFKLGSQELLVIAQRVPEARA